MRNLLVCLLMIFATVAIADEQTRLNVVAFNVAARAEVPNEKVVIILAVEKEARRPADLAALVNADMQWALDKAGANKKVVAETRDYRTDPRYDKSGTVVAWRASQTLVLSGTDIDAASGLATDLQARLPVKSMQFMPTDARREALEDELTVAALERFRARAELIRGSMGMDAYDVIEIQVGHHVPAPRPAFRSRGMAMAMEAAPDMAVSAGSSKLEVSIHGRIQLR